MGGWVGWVGGTYPWMAWVRRGVKWEGFPLSKPSVWRRGKVVGGRRKEEGRLVGSRVGGWVGGGLEEEERRRRWDGSFTLSCVVGGWVGG